MGRIFLIEDDPDLAHLITYNLSKVGFEVKTFGRATDFFRSVEREVPDLILVDVMLPDTDGFRIVKFLKNRADLRHVPVIFLTARTSEEDKIRGFDLGADDYITKPFSIKELIARIRAVLRRFKGEEEGRILEVGGVRLDREAMRVEVDGREVRLTPAEFRILEILMRNYGRPVTRLRIIEELWGIDRETTQRAVDVHIKHIRDKLGRWARLIKTVRGVGYKLER
jgi:DNA-binding response OmpR family regulator